MERKNEERMKKKEGTTKEGRKERNKKGKARGREREGQGGRRDEGR